MGDADPSGRASRGRECCVVDALGLVADVEHHLAVDDPPADIDCVGYDDLTPLDAAVRSDHTDVVGWLDERGALHARVGA